MESTAARTFCALLWLLILIPPALPPTKIADTNTVAPVAVVIEVAAAAAIPEMLKPAD
ncbi:hypothetical protein D3C80_1985260 [compost metagenome]